MPRVCPAIAPPRDQGGAHDATAFGGLGGQWGYVRCVSGGFGGYHPIAGGVSGPIRSDVCSTDPGGAWSYMY